MFGNESVLPLAPERLRYALPKPFFMPFAVAAINRLPSSKLLFRKVSPRRPTAQDPEDPGKHRAVRSRLGRPEGGFCGGKSGRTHSQSASVSLVISGAASAPIAVVAGRFGLVGAPSRRRARRAAWQRLATAWWARRHIDHPSRNDRSSSGSVIAKTKRRTSGTVSVISSN